MRRVASFPLLSLLLMSLLSSCGESTTPGAAPTVTTLTTTGVGTTGATLNGSVNPNGLATDAWFEWGTSSSLANFDTTSIQALGAGTSSQPVMATLSGLSSATTYYYRVAAANSTGPAKGSIESFTTASSLSFGVVSTTPANNATDVPLGNPITVTFNQDVEPATLVDAIAVSSATGNLPGVISYNSTTRTATFAPGNPFAPLTDYTVTVDAKVKSVTTERLPAPYVFVFRSCASSPNSTPITTSVDATSIDGTGATLNGTVNPNGLATQAWFEYGTDPGLQVHASTPNQDVGNGLIAQPVSTTLSALSPGTTYYFRACAENGAGYSAGQILNFTTASSGSPPAVTTVAATSVEATGATLNGSVIPNGLATDAWFEWGTDSSLATYGTTGAQAVGSGSTSQTVNQALTGLTTGTLYYYRVAASNGAGTSKGAILNFRPGAAPTVATLTTTGVGTTGATLNGSVNPNGLATDAWFEWGTSPGLATFGTTSIQALGAGTSSQPVMATLSGLSSATTYYYRVAAANPTGPVKGSIESFTTASVLVFGVVSTSPANNATDVPLGSPITVTFSQDVEPATLVGAITVSSAAGNLPGVTSYNSTTKTAIFTPGTPFALLTDYTVTVAAKVKSVTTARLSAPYIFTFKSGAGSVR